MKIYCTTSDGYHHVLKAFVYLFNKFWGEDQEVIILGYKTPEFELPKNFIFHSMGVQTGLKDWCSDLRKFLELTEDDYFIMTMEDTFFKGKVNRNILNAFKQVVSKDLIRIDLTEGMSEERKEASKKAQKAKAVATKKMQQVMSIKENFGQLNSGASTAQLSPLDLIGRGK